MFNTVARLLAAFILLATSGSALAHPGHDISGLAAGLYHPFSGLDHLLAMLSVGLWAATLGGSAQWKVPSAFVTMLVSGAVFGMSGAHLPLVEPLIAMSVLLLGLAVTFTLRVPANAGVALVGLFALFHGYAHGAELPETASSYLYLLGITLASITLHLTGLGIGHTFKRHTWLLRSSGVAIAAMGMWLVASV
jgi:urease accessory protein